MQKGLTLIELMVAMAVVTVLLSVAVPSYRQLRDDRQLEQVANNVYAYLLQVQNIAFREGRKNYIYIGYVNDSLCLTSSKAMIDINDGQIKKMCKSSDYPYRLMLMSGGNVALGQYQPLSGFKKYMEINGGRRTVVNQVNLVLENDKTLFDFSVNGYGGINFERRSK
ncbi:prepilin-type N-terminal cleavage/methylation domain-containing protein [Plesiomonas shigelloides]|uniref:pilus assembly FimT family protein n=1 Tax=Plesiomonas shigelloides TaxID=703 RepID=UPI0012616F1E|nr:prepilin-type N-terminal cleavage/methylation domain-containing protein [Plesiomonas shigelloides]KAB7712466.1 prepilin-type N-terminal cleavage/methylation domain-containing protein [Plesiomonas shigelloides]